MSGAVTWKNCYGEEVGSISVFVSTMYEESYVRFYYTVTNRSSGEKADYDYKVGLTTTPYHFGGVRYWFICPLVRNGVPCDQRVGTLFLSSGGKYFGCRHCYDLSYKSRNECRLGRFGQIGYALKADRQVEELREKIKRWTYRGRPTRKVRKLNALEQRMERALSISGKLLGL